MVTIRNIYIDILREGKYRMLTINSFKDADSVETPYLKIKNFPSVLLDREFLKVQTLFKMYHKNQAKIELCLKLKFRIPVGESDVFQCFPDTRKEDIDCLTQDFSRIKDKDLFNKVIRVFNFHEKKENRGDTLRRWIDSKFREIIFQLNKTHNLPVYNIKNFDDFIHLYYVNKSRDIHK
jgi:hypothetical protein